MAKLICAVLFFAMLPLKSLAAAREVLEVQVVASNLAPDANALNRDVPKDAKVLLAIESPADQRGDVEAKCLVNGRTIRIAAHIVATDKQELRRVEIEFSNLAPMEAEQIKTNLMVKPNEPKVISAMPGAGEGGRLILMTIKSVDPR